MLTHIVCWKYKPEVTSDQRSAHIDGLRALAGRIDSIRSLTVGSDVLQLDRSFDTGLVATFDDREGLDIYTVHPQHVEIAGLGKILAEAVVSVDFFD